MSDDQFARLVQLACHDLRTPLATVSGFAKTMVRTGELNERDARFAGIIDEAAGQLAGLIDLLGVAARIADGRFDPPLTPASTLELAAGAGDARITAAGIGAEIETSPEHMRAALAALASAALRYGRIERVGWAVAARELTLAPLEPAAIDVVTGTKPSDLGALVAGRVIGALGGTLRSDAATLRVSL